MNKEQMRFQAAAMAMQGDAKGHWGRADEKLR